MALVSSPPSAIVGPITPAATDWWVKDPSDPTSDLKVNVTPGVKTTILEGQGEFRPLGRRYPVIVSDTVQGEDGTHTVWVHDQASFLTLRALLLRQTTMFLRSPYGEQWYIRRTGPLNISRPHPVGWQTSTPYRELSFAYAEQDAPA